MFGVYLNADIAEGRGPMLLKAILPNINDAKLVAKDLEPYKTGGFTEIEDLSAITYESYDDWKNTNDAAVREAALAKLSAREKRVLGLGRYLK